MVNNPVMGAVQERSLKKVKLPSDGILPKADPPDPRDKASAGQAQDLAGINNAHAIRVLETLAQTPGNKIFYPMGPDQLLYALTLGANGETRQQLLDLLKLKEPASFKDLIRGSTGELGEGARVVSVSGLWIDKDGGVLPAFQQKVETESGVRAGVLPFSEDPDTAAAQINQFFSSKTNNWVTSVVTKGELACGRMTLATVDKFTADWATPFVPGKTGRFHLSPADTVEVPTMHVTGAFKTFEYRGHQGIIIPLKGGLGMYVIKGSDEQDTTTILRELALGGISEKDFSNLSLNNDLYLVLPKFSLRQDVPLKDVYTRLGASSAFAAGADFSGITGGSDAYISMFKQTALFDATSKGLSGAGATVAQATTLGIPDEWKADSPFVFFVKRLSETDNAIIVAARVTDPTKQ